MTNRINDEFEKIRLAFLRVKHDLDFLKSENSKLKEEIFYLKNKVDSNKENISINSQKIEIEKEDEQIIGNLDSRKFHYHNCPFAKKISEDNKVEFLNIEDAVKKGFNECVCIREDQN